MHDTEAVARLANVQQHHGVVVVDELRGDDAGVRTKGRLDHELECVRFQSDVVMTKEEEGGAVDHQSRLIARRSETAILLKDSDVGAGRDRGDSGRDVVRLPVRHDEQAQFLVVLSSQRSNSDFQTWPRTGGNDDGDNGRCTRFHQYFKASWLPRERWTRCA